MRTAAARRVAQADAAAKLVTERTESVLLEPWQQQLDAADRLELVDPAHAAEIRRKVGEAMLRASGQLERLARRCLSA